MILGIFILMEKIKISQNIFQKPDFPDAEAVLYKLIIHQ